jgi:hypothetical protein
MDLDNPVICLCLASAQAEFEKRLEDARALATQAVEIAQDEYEACVAVHYMARYQETPESILAWNEKALRHADAVGDARAHDFYPSLYVNLGYGHELCGHAAQAEHCYHLAESLGLRHELRPSDYLAKPKNESLRDG